MSEAGDDVVRFRFGARLTVCVDVKDPHSYLALGPVQALADQLGEPVDWLPFPAAAPKPPPPGQDRGSRHRRFRARYLEADIHRYAEVQGLTIHGIYRNPESGPASLGLLWLRRHAAELTGRYLQRVFAGYWREELDVSSVDAVAGVLEALGQSPASFLAFAERTGPDELDSLRQRLVAAGVFTVPTLVVESEVLVGRAHVPMARWLLTGRSGPPPV